MIKPSVYRCLFLCDEIVWVCQSSRWLQHKITHCENYPFLQKQWWNPSHLQEPSSSGLCLHHFWISETWDKKWYNHTTTFWGPHLMPRNCLGQNYKIPFILCINITWHNCQYIPTPQQETTPLHWNRTSKETLNGSYSFRAQCIRVSADQIGLHSARSGTAMAMFLVGVSVFQIMFLGRW